MALLSKTLGLCCKMHIEGDDDDTYIIPRVRGGSGDNDGDYGDYDYAPLFSEGDDDDDGGYDYAPAA